MVSDDGARREHRKAFGRYLVPSMLTMMLMAVYTFTDTYVVGRSSGSVAVGAMGVCTPVLTVAYAFGFLFGMGGAGRYAIALGQGRETAAKNIFCTSVAAALACGTVAAVVLSACIRPFARFLGAGPRNIAYVLPYLRVLVAYIPGFMLDVVMVCFMKNDGHPTIAMIATATGTIMNVVLDFLFVFGFGWGMFGAAFATALCSGIGCAINCGCALAYRMRIRFRLRDVRVREIPKILKNGASVLVLESSSGIVTFVFIAQAQRWYGAAGASVYTIIMNWALICTNLVLGVAQASQPLLGRAYGKGEADAVRDFLRYALTGAMALGCSFLIVGYGMADELVSVFAKDDVTVVRLAVPALRRYLPAFCCMGAGIVIGSTFQALGMAVEALAVMLSRGIVLPCAFAFLLPALAGPRMLWAAVPLAEFATSILAMVLLRAKRKPADK